MVDQGIDEIASSAGRLARAYGSADSTQALRSQVLELQQRVEQNAQALQDRAEEAMSRAERLVDKIETAIHSWENVQDVDGLKQAVNDTAKAGEELGEALLLLGAAVTFCDPPLGVAISGVGLAIKGISAGAEEVVGQTSDLIDPQGETGGRLGTVFSRGFNCPLLVQIGEEIAGALPHIIGPTHQLRQMWGYKNGRQQPVTPPHADFAAVNVNIWLTPDSANLDPETGGLDIYDVEAPPSWEFDKYNKDGRAIREFLRESAATVTKVPYRANRAIIFNSDLFHATQALSFDEGYANRRINVTFLFGRREDDENGHFNGG